MRDICKCEQKIRTSQLIPSQSLLQGVNSSIVTLNDNFIEGDTFEVVLKRNSLGLGLSVSGGPEGKIFFVYLCKSKYVLQRSGNA